MDNNTTPPTDTVPYILGQLVSKVDTLLHRTDGYDKRIAAVERKQWWLSGASAVLGFVIAKLSTLIGIFPH
jgi:hypothetical protein